MPQFEASLTDDHNVFIIQAIGRMSLMRFFRPSLKAQGEVFYAIKNAQA
jgi:hypothetical protein